MYPSAQECFPGALYPLEISAPKRLPPVAAVPCQVSKPPSMSAVPPPVYGSHSINAPIPVHTTTTEGYRRDTESGASIEPPRRKKSCCLVTLAIFLVLCILVTGIGIMDWINTAKREGASLLADEQELERLYSPILSSSPSQLQIQTPKQTGNWAFPDVANLLGLSIFEDRILVAS
ncbi:hypothetical protein EV426DRAFT_580662 [Tirmania nivea]|nr:hypothetical protein EV426DRAFT_580662 [Tirmania nivea]